MNALTHLLERTIHIQAAPETVFRYFTESPRWAAWWGAGSTIEPRPGGRMLIRHPNGIEVSGEVVEIAAPTRIVFTYGYASGSPFGPGASRVTIALARAGDGTRLDLSHEFSEAAARDHHVQGWRYQLSLFANLVSDESNAGAAERVDAWFRAWAEADDAARGRQLATIATPSVRFRDRFSFVDGVDELSQQIGAYHRFMPGIRIARKGDVRHCQGLVLAEWTASAPDGSPRGGGANVFSLAADGRIDMVTGFWAPQQQG